MLFSFKGERMAAAKKKSATDSDADFMRKILGGAHKAGHLPSLERPGKSSQWLPK